MSRIAVHIAFLPFVLLAALAGCGETQPTVDPKALIHELRSPDKTRVKAALGALSRQAAAEPARVVPLLIDELALLRRGQVSLVARVTPDLAHLPEDKRPAAALELARFLRARLGAAGFPVRHLSQDGPTVEVHIAPPEDEAQTTWVREQLHAELTRTGGFELRAEVPPPFAPTPERPRSPWPGDAASYTAWLSAESALFGSAGSDPARYVASRPDVALVATAGTPEAHGARFVPLETAQAGDAPLGEGDFVAQARDDAALGAPSLYLHPQPGREEHVRAGLARAAGLTLWLVSDGRALAGVRVPGKPGVALSIPVGGKDVEQARLRATALAVRVGLGRLPWPVKVERVDPPLEIPVDHPLCEALVAAGPAAEAPLQALAEREPAFEPLVRALGQEILRARTR